MWELIIVLRSGELASRPRRVKARVISSRLIRQSWLVSNRSNTRRRRTELRLGDRRWKDLLEKDLRRLVLMVIGASGVAMALLMICY
ncbi:hypothetical protein HanIR_Chr01g0000621 [Helianthus annuus]|nr:hypothetical protein HanIR_Chr01g0000621 [Helianthus annuus]